MVVGQLELQMFASMARLQSDMDNAKRTVGGAVNSINQVLGTIGVGLSFAGIATLVKSVVDVGDKLNDLSKITGLTVAELGGLGKAAKLNGTDLDSVAKAIGLMSKNMYAGSASFATLGIATKDASGQLRNANQVFLDVADKFSSIEDGAAKSALAAQLFGKSGRDLIPMLNEGRSAIEGNIESYAKYSGMTQQTAQASDQFNDTLAELQGRVTAIKTSFVGALLPTLNTIGAAMLSTGKSTNQFSFAASVVVPVLKGLAITGLTVIDTFRGMGREIGARAAQLTALAKLDFKGAAFIGTELAEDNKKARAEFDKLFDTILNGDKSIQNLTETQKEYLKIEQQVPGAVDKTTRALKEKQVLTDAEQLAALRQAESTRSTIELSRQVEQVTQSVATEQEIYNQRLAELEQLKPYLSVETYNRALQKAQEELGKTSDAGKAAYNEIDQYAVQAARNIQTSLANFLFDPFQDGLKGMVTGVINAVRRMVAEFAALKISQSLGLQQMFSGLSGASSGGVSSALSGSGGGIGGALNLASLGSNAMNMVKTGFGTTGMASTAISGIGRFIGSEALSAFGAGMAGVGTAGASAGIFSAAGGAGTAFIGGTGTAIGGAGMGAAASMGSSLAAAAGPLAVVAIADVVFRMLAGNKLTGSKVIDSIPIIGSLGALFFGRGPLKQKETNLIGDFSSDGFSGITSTKFKAQGGLARSSKVDRVMIDTDTGNLLNEYKGLVEGGISKVLDPFAREAAVAAVQLGKYLDDVTTSTAESMQKVGESLGKGKDAMEGFYYGVNIASEKGKSLTDEQISGVLADMADTMARHVIPNIDAFRKAGESAADAALRIGNEFDALVSASAVLGVSLGTARTVLQQSSIEGRTAFIEAAGGIDALNSKAQYFAANFLDGSEIIQRNAELLAEQMSELGLSTDMTKEDFKNLVQSFGQVGGVSEEMLISLLNIAPLFNQVKTAADAAGMSIEGLATALVLTNQEAIAVGTVLGNVGYSFSNIMQVLRDVPAEEITAFVNKVGGIDNLLASSGAFAQNFLTGAELAQTKADYLAKQFADLGIRSNLTAQDFKDLVQGVGEFSGVSVETRVAVAALSNTFSELYGGTNQLNQAAIAVGTVLGNVGYGFSTVVQALKDFSAEDIRAFVANAGGIEGLLNSSSVFADNFLTAAQKTQFQADYLAQRLTGLGLSANISAESFRDLIMGQGEFANASKELRAQALLLTGDFIKVKGGMDGLSGSLGGLGAATQTAAVSVNDLIQIGLNFGLSMQKIGSLIGSSTQDQLNAWAANNPNALQQSEFFKQNFLTPLESFNADAQKLANDLSSIGIDSNISRSGFASILQDFSDPAKQTAASNLMQLYDSVHDRMEASAQAAADFVAPVAQILNQDAINAANDNIRNAQSSLTQAQNEVNQARQNEINLLQQTADKFRGYEQAMKNASNALALSAASPLTPMQKYQEASSQLRAAANSGDYEKLQQAGSAFLEASKLVNASGSQYSSDYAFVKGLYDQAASAAGKQASDAERQLGALGTINDSVLTVAQAVNNLAAAQSAYNAAKSAIPAPVYSTPSVQAPQVLSMPSANFDMSNVVQFPSDTQIRDFVNANYGDWMTVYKAAKQYGVSSDRLSQVTGIALSDIKDWVTANNLPMFERGTDYVKSGGLAILHKAEAVTPASSMSDMANAIAELTAENREIRKQLEESNRKLSSLIGTVAKSSDKNADRIVRNSDKQSFYREVRRA